VRLLCSDFSLATLAAVRHKWWLLCDGHWGWRSHCSVAVDIGTWTRRAAIDTSVCTLWRRWRMGHVSVLCPPTIWLLVSVIRVSVDAAGRLVVVTSVFVASHPHLRTLWNTSQAPWCYRVDRLIWILVYIYIYILYARVSRVSLLHVSHEIKKHHHIY